VAASRETRRWRAALIARLAAAVALCLCAALAQAEDRREILSWQGNERSYLLHLPDRAGGTALPLVVVLHGAGGNGADFAAETQFAAAETALKAILVFPDGVQAEPGRGTWDAHFCCGKALADRLDDIGFIGALIERIAAERKIDRTRVYATGMSNGGMMTYQLAAAHPDWFAAVAPVSATIGGTARSGASFLIDVPARPVSLMIIHGRRDQSIPYDGGVAPNASLPRIWKMSVADALSFWSAANGCPPAPQASEPVPGKLRRIAYAGCRDESEIVHWEIEDGGHYWPDSPFPGPGGQPRSAAAEILSFFAAHSR